MGCLGWMHWSRAGIFHSVETKYGEQSITWQRKWWGSRPEARLGHQNLQLLGSHWRFHPRISSNGQLVGKSVALDSDRIAIGNPRSKRSSTPGKQYSYKWFIIFVVEKSNGGGGGEAGHSGHQWSSDLPGKLPPNQLLCPASRSKIPLAVYVRLHSFGSKANN